MRYIRFAKLSNNECRLKGSIFNEGKVFLAHTLIYISQLLLLAIYLRSVIMNQRIGINQVLLYVVTHRISEISMMCSKLLRYDAEDEVH